MNLAPKWRDRRDGATTVANDSTTRMFVVRPDVGPERTVGVGEALTLSVTSFSIVVHGQIYTHTHTLAVEAPRPSSSALRRTASARVPTAGTSSTR